MREILPGIHQLQLGSVNAYLVDHGHLTLIDTGSPGQEEKILSYLQQIGKRPGDIDHILLTHFHPDHIGGLARLGELSGARTFMHGEDARDLAEGRCFRERKELAPGLLNRVVYNLFIKGAPSRVSPYSVSQAVQDGDYLFIGKGMKVIGTPGHTAGHLSFLYLDQGGVLFGGDAAATMWWLAPMPFYEDMAAGRESLKKLGGFTYETACFGHGKPILRKADSLVRKKFGQPAG